MTWHTHCTVLYLRSPESETFFGSDSGVSDSDFSSFSIAFSPPFPVNHPTNGFRKAVHRKSTRGTAMHVSHTIYRFLFITVFTALLTQHSSLNHDVTLVAIFLINAQFAIANQKFQRGAHARKGIHIWKGRTRFAQEPEECLSYFWCTISIMQIIILPF